MAQLEFKDYSWEEAANSTDARVIKWPLISSSMPMIYIMLTYIYVVYFGGPRFMKNRQPYLLKGFMQYYNIFQVITNFWLMLNVMTYGKPLIMAWRYCDSMEEIYGHDIDKIRTLIYLEITYEISNVDSHNIYAMISWNQIIELINLKIIELGWWTLVVKIIDLSETVMFVLRKKNKQISVLHVYHHITTVLYIWILLRYLNHGYGMTILAINATVHVIMYSYYFLSTYGSNMQRILKPFKKWITFIQIIQILFVMMACLQGFTSYCDNNKIARYLTYLTFSNAVANFSLFFNFYINSYKRIKAS